MRKFSSLILLGLGALLAPSVVLRAADPPQRYYDRSARDYHDWNDNEQRAYRRYSEEQHREYRDLPRTSKREQQNYWRWRHQHSDDNLWRQGSERPRGTEHEK